MSKLTLTEAVKVIPVSESTLCRDMKRGKVSLDPDPKRRKQIDVSELTRFYGPLKQLNGTQLSAAETAESAEPVNHTHPHPSLNGNETSQVIALLEGFVFGLNTSTLERSGPGRFGI